MEKILCPTDFTSCSRNALDYAQELAKTLSSKLLFFHTVPAPEHKTHMPVGGVPFMEPIPDPDEKKAREMQISIAKEKLFALAQDYPGSESQLRVGPITTTLAQAAHETEADLIVLGHEGLQDIFPASVTSQIIRNVPCPVLIIPTHGTFKPLRKIVFATDLRGDAFTDISFVSQVAAAFNAQIQFLHVLTDDDPETRATAEAGLRLICKRSYYPNVSYFLESDPTVQEGISRFCFKENAELLVMGSRNKNFWQFQFLTDKTQNMASNAFLPLLVLPYKK